jgi:hypothetical protein
MIENTTSAIPNLPRPERDGEDRPAVKIATPDLIVFDENAVSVEYMTDLIFENIGGQEILSLTRNDLINGQNVLYSLIGNRESIGQKYNSLNLFRVPGGVEEYFGNFAINFANHVPENGTGPNSHRVGELNTLGCSGYPVIRNEDDSVVACLTTIKEAQARAEKLSDLKPFVYINPENGDLVIDVVNLGTNDQVDVEILSSGVLLDATIY